MKTNKIMKYPITFISMLFLIGCTPSEVEPKEEKVQVAPACVVDTKVAPAWVCKQVDEALIKTTGLLSESSTLFKEFKKGYDTHAKKVLASEKLSKQDSKAILQDSRINLQEIEKEWQDQNSTAHIVYSLSESEIKENIKESIAKYKYTRTYENCFITGKVSVQKSCKNKINAFLKKKSVKNKKNIIIEVHTDKGGSAKKNLRISKKRALNVALSVQTQEQKYSKIYYAGYGESQVLFDEETKEANFYNRRVVVSVKDKNYTSKVKVLAAYKTKGFVPFKPELKKSSKKSVKKIVAFESSKKEVIKVKTVTAVVKPKKYVNLKRYTGKSIVGSKSKFTISCSDDVPVKMKRKETNTLKQSAFMSNFYKKRVSGSYEDKYVEIYPINILRNGSLATVDPVVTVYSDRADTMRYETEVNLYRGKSGLLYRVFIKGNKDIKCMDFVFSYSHSEQKYGKVYLEKKGTIKELKFIAE